VSPSNLVSFSFLKVVLAILVRIYTEDLARNQLISMVLPTHIFRNEKELYLNATNLVMSGIRGNTQMISTVQGDIRGEYKIKYPSSLAQPYA